MVECTGSFFIYNSEIKPVEQFIGDFLSLDEYIYEVIRVASGVPLFIKDHIGRLEQTTKLQNTRLPYPCENIIGQVKTLTEKNNFKYGNIKIVFIPFDVSKNKFEFLIYINPHQYPTEAQYINGVGVSVYQGIRYNPNAKLMHNSLRQKTFELKLNTSTYETLLFDNEGNVTECSRSNIFFIKDGVIFTPPATDVLPGITRKKILYLCDKLNISYKEQRLKLNEIDKMDAVFISSTSRKVLPVDNINSINYIVDHPVTRKIQKAFDNLIDDYIRKNS